MPVYDCLTPIKYGGKHYRDSIELSAAEAAPLIAEGLIAERPKPKAAPKKSAEPKADPKADPKPKAGTDDPGTGGGGTADPVS